MNKNKIPLINLLKILFFPSLQNFVLNEPENKFSGASFKKALSTAE